MPDPVETPAVESTPTEAERMDAVFEAATAEAEVLEPVAPPPSDDAEDAPPVEAEPAAAIDQEPAPPATDPVEPAPDDPPVELTQEQQDDAAAKDFGFKNQRANAEFKRMRGVEREHKALQERLPELEAGSQRWGEMYGYLQQHQITPERFKQGMTMTAALSSSDPAVLAKARDGLEWELKELNKKLGIAGNGYDPLAETANADLAEAVRNEEMTSERAQQVARERTEAAHYRTKVQQTQEQQTAAAAHTSAVKTAAMELDAVQAEYEKLDPRFAEKADILVRALKPVFARIPPSEWAPAFKQAYQDLVLPAVAAPAPARQAPAPLRNQPLRASPITPGGASVTATAPEDIMRQALEHAAAMDGVPFRG